MSEGIVIALIGFAGAVLGAAIAGFATVTAAGIKGKGEGSISCGLVGLLASLGAAGGLVLGAIFGAAVIQQRVATPQPSITMQQPAQPTPKYQPIPTQRTIAPSINCAIGTPLPHRAPVVGQPWILPSGGWIIVNFWSNEPGVDQTEHKLLLGPNDPRTLLGGGSAWQWPIECESIVRENYLDNPLPPITLEDLRAQGLVR